MAFIFLAAALLLCQHERQCRWFPPVGSVDKTVSARGHDDGTGGKRDGLLHIHAPISVCYIHEVPGELSVQSSPNNIPQHTSSMS